MTRLLLLPLPPLALLLAVLAFAGCGGSDGLVNVAGSSRSISKQSVNHWMQALVGLDFRSTIGTKSPRGLVSEPADYTRCVEAMKKIAPRTFSGQLKMSESELAVRCHDLHRSVKAQALSFLISTNWTIDEGAEQGVKVSDAELRREFARLRQIPYPTEAKLHSYLTERRWVLSDLLYFVKRSILVTRILPKFQAKVNKIGGGQKTYVKLGLERYQALIAKTSCRAGYVAPGCREYHGPTTVLPAPNSILEEVAETLGRQ